MLTTTIALSTKTAIRTTIALTRYIAIRQELENPSAKPNCTAFCFVRDGDKGIFGGYGDMYDYFVKNKILQQYFGEDEDFTLFGTPGYDDAKFKLLKFDESYTGLHYDASDRKLLLLCINK